MRSVLVVDDEPLILDDVAAMLEELGCTVLTAASGAEALQRLAENERIEILLTDVNMPGMDGYSLVQRAKRFRPDLKVLLLSGRESEKDDLPLVRKPFLKADLTRVMSKTDRSLLTYCIPPRSVWPAIVYRGARPAQPSTLER
jgi:two-component system cell cycle response regulator CpdR